MNEDQKSFREFKSEWTLNYEHEDYFLDYVRFGCHETAFEKWLKSQRLFIKRYAGGRVESELA